MTSSGELARQVGSLLRAQRRTVGVAESCTGGLLGAALTAVPGSSTYVTGGVIAYADSVKMAVLGVAPEMLSRVGAVSEEVAAAMALGVRSVVGSDIGIGITGIAGPGSDDTEKPVGLVYIALSAGSGQDTVEGVFVRTGDEGRTANREDSVIVALGGLVAYLSGDLPPGKWTAPRLDRRGR